MESSILTWVISLSHPTLTLTSNPQSRRTHAARRGPIQIVPIRETEPWAQPTTQPARPRPAARGRNRIAALHRLPRLNVTQMVYSPEPKALARTDAIGRFFEAEGRKSAAAGRISHRAQKANTSSMSRGSSFFLSNPAAAPPETTAFCFKTSYFTAFTRPCRNLSMAVALLIASAAGFAITPSANAQSAGTWSKRGADAEVREDYDTAYTDYKHAHDKKPKDLRYLAHFELSRGDAAHRSRPRAAPERRLRRRHPAVHARG
jgi:hypothetical protein